MKKTAEQRAEVERMREEMRKLPLSKTVTQLAQEARHLHEQTFRQMDKGLLPPGEVAIKLERIAKRIVVIEELAKEWEAVARVLAVAVGVECHDEECPVDLEDMKVPDCCPECQIRWAQQQVAAKGSTPEERTDE